MIVAVTDALPRGVCRGRARYADEAEAIADARDRHATVDRKQGAYPCRACGGWHLERRRWLR